MEPVLFCLALAVIVQAVGMLVFVALLPLLFWRVFKQDEQLTLLRLKLAAIHQELNDKIVALDTQLADHLALDPDYIEIDK